MRYGIFSDIHGNLEAFQAVLEACRQEGVRKLFCVGDIVGYGANPRECLKIIRQKNISSVAGNHDWAATGKISDDNFNEVAQFAVRWTGNQLSYNELNYLNHLPLIAKEEDMIFVHGTLNKPERFDYLLDIRQTPDTFFLMDQPICFIGHTHVAQIYIKEENNIHYASIPRTDIHPAKKYIVNVGSVGQPRDGNPLAAYCVYDPDLKRIEIKRTSYDLLTAQKKILEAGLPDMLAKRLALGQ